MRRRASAPATALLLSLWALIALLAPLVPVPAAQPERIRLELADTLGQRHVVAAELALSPQSRASGLMFRRHLAAGEGMLFVFPSLKPVRMWMRNTLLSLDMLFFDEGGTLVAVHPRCQPLSDELHGPGLPVRAVLELPAGAAARLSMVPGARLVSPAIGELLAR